MTLKALREAAHLTQREVAEKLQVSVRSVAYYETGQRVINVFQVLTLSELFDVSAEDIIIAELETVAKPDKIVRRHIE